MASCTEENHELANGGADGGVAREAVVELGRRDISTRSTRVRRRSTVPSVEPESIATISTAHSVRWWATPSST